MRMKIQWNQNVTGNNNGTPYNETVLPYNVSLVQYHKSFPQNPSNLKGYGRYLSIVNTKTTY